MRIAAALIALSMLPLTLGTALAECTAFSGSSMDYGSGNKAVWRNDYPGEITSTFQAPWSQIRFQDKPVDYMNAVLGTAKAAFHRDGRKLVGAPDADWWVSEWLDYGDAGRERLMGLTKERGPDARDLSPTSGKDWQVWAVGFYNVPGAVTLGEVFADPCDPSLPVRLDFPDNTASVKFLFTNAPPEEVSYLAGAPEYDALIDDIAEPDPEPKKRVLGALRLLQVDIAVKEGKRAKGTTGWVFGTFGWVGPTKGDGLFDNLVPVSLQWGNDPGVYNTVLKESWVNTDLKDIMYGWPERPNLGFHGRANGPADNIRSSCLSCHAAARTPRADLGIVGSSLRLPGDLSDPVKIIAHVDTWFKNIPSGNTFQPETPVAATLDYSLQLESAVFRMCTACNAGDLTGATPDICVRGGFRNRPMCLKVDEPNSPENMSRKRILQMMPPPRQ